MRCNKPTWKKVNKLLTYPEMLDSLILAYIQFMMGTAVAQWLRCCATNQNVAGLIPDGVIGIFH